MDNIKHSYGKYLRAARKRKGLSSQQLADICGVSRTAISRYENGLLQPGLDMRIKLSKTLNIPMEMMSTVTSDADMSLPTMIELWQRIGPDDKIRALDYLSSLAAKNLTKSH